MIGSNKSRREIPFKTKKSQIHSIWKKSIKIVTESKLSFFTTFPSSIFLFPPPQFYYFRSSFLNSLLHNFIIFTPHSWIPSSTILIFSLNFFIPSTTILIFPSILLFFLLLFLLLISIVFPLRPIKIVEEGIQEWGAKIIKLWRRE